MTDGAARGDRDIRARGGCSHGVSAGVRSPTVQRQKAEQRDGHSGQRVARTACPGRCSEVPHAADLSWARTGRDHGSLSGPDCDSSHAALTSRKRQRKPSDPSRHRQEVLESTRWVVRVCAGQSTHRQVRSKDPAAERTRAGGPEVAGSNPAPATKKVQVSPWLTWTFALGARCDPIVYPSHWQVRSADPAGVDAVGSGRFGLARQRSHTYSA